MFHDEYAAALAAAAAAPKSVCPTETAEGEPPESGDAEVADAGGLEEIDANDWAGEGNMLGETEADEGAD